VQAVRIRAHLVPVAVVGRHPHALGLGEGAQRIHRGLDRVAHHDGRGQQRQPPLVDVRQHEQVVGRAAEPADLLAQALEHLARRGRQCVVAEADVELGAHDGQRRAQLVRRVGHQLVLLGDPLLEAVEHRVERDREVADLVARARHRDALVEPVDPDPVGLRGHPLHRHQRLARQPPADEGGADQRRRPGQQQQHQDAPDRLLDAVQRLGDDQQPRAADARDAPDEGAEASIGLDRGGDQPRRSAQRGGPDGGRDERTRASAFAVAHLDPAARVQDLRPGARSRQGGLALVEEVLRPALAVADGDRRGGAADLPVDGQPQVRAQPQHQERAEDEDDRREQDRVPDGEADADRQVHSSSRTKPTPRTVRISRAPPGRSSFLRR